MVTGSSLSFKFRILNDDGTPAKHTDLTDVVVYVYVYENRVVKFSKSAMYNPLGEIDEYWLRVDCTPEQTRYLGPGIPVFALYIAVAAPGYPDGQLHCKGRWPLLSEPLVTDPISDEE